MSSSISRASSSTPDVCPRASGGGTCGTISRRTGAVLLYIVPAPTLFLVGQVVSYGWPGMSLASDKHRVFAAYPKRFVQQKTPSMTPRTGLPMPRGRRRSKKQMVAAMVRPRTAEGGAVNHTPKEDNLVSADRLEYHWYHTVCRELWREISEGRSRFCSHPRLPRRLLHLAGLSFPPSTTHPRIVFLRDTRARFADSSLTDGPVRLRARTPLHGFGFLILCLPSIIV